MKNTITPLYDAYGKVRDFYVKINDCEACAKRREKIKQFARISGKKARDFLRRPGGGK